MAIANEPRNQMIRAAVTQRPDAVLAVTIRLWESLATELISIIGEGGFQSLYARSVHLTASTFPWIVPDQAWQQSESRFAELKNRLGTKDVAEAGEASIALLITFLDLLATLIGEMLTTNILRSAWGNGALDSDVKEQQ